jgi:hypothetical protein
MRSVRACGEEQVSGEGQTETRLRARAGIVADGAAAAAYVL